MKRVFIAINLPEEIKEKLTEWQKVHKNFNVRWTKKDSIHITLYFLGDTEEKQIPSLGEALRKIAKNHKPFDIYLNEITVGPDEQRPRMIWVAGPVTEELKNLYKDIAEAMKLMSRIEDRPFKLHITLARAGYSRIRPFKEEIDLRFSAKSFELMEAELLPDGAEYGVIESFALK